MKDNWLETYYQHLEEKRRDISDSDFRFHNINRLPLIAAKTLEFSRKCTECKANIKALEELTGMLPSCLNEPNGSKSFEQKRNKIEKHLKKEHGMRHAHHHYAVYSLLGIAAGATLGIMISWIVFNNLQVNLLLVLSALGLIAGQISGKRKDKLFQRRGKQI